MCFYQPRFKYLNQVLLQQNEYISIVEPYEILGLPRSALPA